MTILSLTDIHGAATRLQEVLDSCSGAERPDLILVAGDLTHLGGRREAEELLASLQEGDQAVLAVPGNMDRGEVLACLEEHQVSLHGRGRMIGSTGFMGLGGSGRTPFGTPFELSAAESRALLDSGWKDIEKASFKVLVSHTPPAKTKLDRVASGLHVGSAEVREFLESHPLDLCLSGHVHESPGEDRVGKVLCLNTGPAREGRYCLIRLQRPDITIDWRRV